MGEPTEELEPLFDYSRVQHSNFVCLDDDCSDSPPAPFPKRHKKTVESCVEKENGHGKVVQIVNIEDQEEDDWLPPPPPKATRDTVKLGENSTIKELRLKKQELASFAQSAADALRAVEESARRDLNVSLQSAVENAGHQARPPCERAKIVISIQGKDELKQFRVYMDDKFEKLFKLYADKVQLDVRNLVFCFDGDRICPTATPGGLGMEDDDIIEVHVKSG